MAFDPIFFHACVHNISYCCWRKNMEMQAEQEKRNIIEQAEKLLILCLLSGHWGSGFTSKGGQNWWVTIFLSCLSSKNTTTTTALSENNSIFKLMHYKPMTLNSLSCFFFSPLAKLSHAHTHTNFFLNTNAWFFFALWVVRTHNYGVMKLSQNVSF